MKTEEIMKLEEEHVMQTYTRFKIVVESGKGCYVYDKEGKKYLDFLGGIATCSVGHGNKEVAKAISEQAKKLIGISNLYYTEPQAVLAEKLSKLSGLKKCFFCNSGAEANEAAIKLVKKITGKKKFIAFEHCFHGRTAGSLAATWKEKYKTPFLPLAPDVIFVEYNNIAALENAITPEIAAVIIEPIQGEAGIIVPDEGYLKKLSELCKKNNVLLIADEVQSGTGRTGKFFAYQHEGIIPDIATLAKGIGNGVPIGVCISNLDFDKGNHASTFGGNNLCCAAANAVIDFIEKKKLMDNAVKIGNYFMKKLSKIDSPLIKKVKGKGLMIGVELNEDKAKEIVDKCLEKGLILNNATDNILRFLPPLIVKKKEVDEAIKILEEVLK
ncbi:MAG: acetylornithine transaminase [Nanoarchaeota archaeon]|nr:acetylornithine transaminase [Nanoarchaeota archaeon]MBU1005912.1 acetylornithine transaminase [Nanoarchaeota archaeon]MBU1945383.1 acetylornithine transaminase [Nanoarchaeota archaeon]